MSCIISVIYPIIIIVVVVLATNAGKKKRNSQNVQNRSQNNNQVNTYNKRDYSNYKNNESKYGDNKKSSKITFTKKKDSSDDENFFHNEINGGTFFQKDGKGDIFSDSDDKIRNGVVAILFIIVIGLIGYMVISG